MVALPPGTLLQLIYLEERLKLLPPGRFVEMGPGSGEITAILLANGWSGSAYDLEDSTIKKLGVRFAHEINRQQLKVIHGDFIDSPDEQHVDLIISCMVMEHLTDAQLAKFMARSARLLTPNGRMIGFVPASPKHWGIEDDIAGHLRRYTRTTLKDFLEGADWNILHISGLTYPVSNLLLPLSNYLVKRSESHKLSFDNLERTRLSGNRDVPYKTSFPGFAALILNRWTMLPLHYLQKAYANTEAALVLYFESAPRARTNPHE